MLMAFFFIEIPHNHNQARDGITHYGSDKINPW